MLSLNLNCTPLFVTDLQQLKKILNERRPLLFCSSKTSCVIPYSTLLGAGSVSGENHLMVADLSTIPGEMTIHQQNHSLVIRGAISWQEGRNFCRQQQREIKCSPTEELALILAGVATSATGERAFGYGGVRSQIISCEMMDFRGQEIKLRRDQSLKAFLEEYTLSRFSTEERNEILPPLLQSLERYQKDYEEYQDFKNAPFPRMEKAIDLMIGTEGQLGVVTAVELETTARQEKKYFLLKLPAWDLETRSMAHREVLEKVQLMRGKIICCEMIDHHALALLQTEDTDGEKKDMLLLEVIEEEWERVVEEFFVQLENISEDDIFEISEKKFHQLRAEVPRKIAEYNARLGLVKKGTDVQVPIKHFPSLLEFYRRAKELNIPYTLFGHFGDAHLHLNFLCPKDEESSKQCAAYFEELYQKVIQWKGSPFAEHGVGFIKQPYIHDFYGTHQWQLFSLLKKVFDPYQQFFPMGFMSMRQKV